MQKRKLIACKLLDAFPGRFLQILWFVQMQEFANTSFQT